MKYVKTLLLSLGVVSSSAVYSQNLTETKLSRDEDLKIQEGWNRIGQISAKFNTNESSMVPSQKDGLTQIYGLNLDLAGIHKIGRVTWKNSFEDETAFSRLPGLPKASKTADEVRLATQLNFALTSKPEIGAYGKAGIRSNLLDAEDVREEKMNFVGSKRNGETFNETTDVFKTGTSLGRKVTRESLGVFYTPLTPSSFTAEVRFGFGLEQSIVKETQFILRDDKDTTSIEYVELEGYHIGGLEYGLESAYKMGDKMMLLLSADGLTPLFVDQKIKDQFGSDTTKLTSWTLSAKTSLSLYTWLALGWEYKLRREPLVQAEVQKTQSLTLNATYNLFVTTSANEVSGLHGPAG